MKAKKLDMQGIPTNIITGFLGVGKTSTILQLLKNKPVGERWAVLVNEFGEIGIDGSLLSGQQTEGSGVYIREVPGGCMCCAAGLPMQIALNHLLITARPDRLLIEPTGLGHPKEILQVLSSEHYRETLSLQKTLTLVDARNLNDKRYTNHETFNQQIAIADTVIGNKADQYTEQDHIALVNYIKAHGATHVKVILATHGDIELEALAGKTAITLDKPAHHHHHGPDNSQLADTPIPECGFIKAVNEGEGFESVGWRFASETIFEYNKLVKFLMAIDADRMKAVFVTDEGLFGFNLDKGTLTELRLRRCEGSRIEIISHSINQEWLEPSLMRCRQAH
jgi:G3E family GTPase